MSDTVATKYFASIIHYSLAFKFNILMFYLYTNLSVCSSLMTGFLFIFQVHYFVLLIKDSHILKRPQFDVPLIFYFAQD